VLATLTVFMCLSRVIHGSFVADDWSYRALAHFNSFGGIVHQQLEQDVRRPLAAVYFATLFTLIGSHIRLMLLFAAMLRFVLALSLYGVLRELRFEWLAATAVAALTLLFPETDSTWLWATASLLPFALSCVLLGSLLNLRAVQAEKGKRRSLRIVGITLIAAGILSYELVAPLGLASGCLYLTQTDARKALRAWRVDLIALGAIIVIFTLHIIPVLHGGDVHEIVSFAQMRAHVALILSQSATLLAHSLLPFGTPRNSTVLGLAGVLMALAVIVAALLRPGSDSRRRLLQWTLVACIGGLVVAIGYLPLVPANIYYVPLQAGIGNRINIVSGIGYALVVYSTLALLGVLVFRDLPHSRYLAGTLTAVGAVVIGVGYARRFDADKTAWRQAATLERSVLAALSAVPTPARGTSIITLDAPTEAAPGVPVFSASWDLAGAVQLKWNDPTLKAYPMAAGMTIRCAASLLSVSGVGGQSSWQGSYPTDFIDVASNSVLAVTSRPTCINATTALGVSAQ
jgi:hypothetical protein